MSDNAYQKNRLQHLAGIGNSKEQLTENEKLNRLVDDLKALTFSVERQVNGGTVDTTQMEYFSEGFDGLLGNLKYALGLQEQEQDSDQKFVIKSMKALLNVLANDASNNKLEGRKQLYKDRFSEIIDILYKSSNISEGKKHDYDGDGDVDSDDYLKNRDKKIKKEMKNKTKKVEEGDVLKAGEDVKELEEAPLNTLQKALSVYKTMVKNGENKGGLVATVANMVGISPRELQNYLDSQGALEPSKGAIMASADPSNLTADVFHPELDGDDLEEAKAVDATVTTNQFDTIDNLEDFQERTGVKDDRATKVKVPKEILADVDKRIKELKVSAEKYDKKGYDQTSLKQQAIDVLNQFKDNLSSGDLEGLKQAQIYFLSLKNTLQHLLPSSLIKFVATGDVKRDAEGMKEVK